jgi:hypothetical protein
MAGNSNSGRKNWEKPISDALRLALKQNDQKALNNGIRNIISQFQAGTPWAVEFVTDRLEGKAIQQIDSTAVVEHRYVKAPEKAKDDDWKQYLAHKTKPAQPVKSNGSNGSTH